MYAHLKNFCRISWNKYFLVTYDQQNRNKFYISHFNLKSSHQFFLTSIVDFHLHTSQNFTNSALRESSTIGLFPANHKMFMANSTQLCLNQRKRLNLDNSFSSECTIQFSRIQSNHQLLYPPLRCHQCIVYWQKRF